MSTPPAAADRNEVDYDVVVVGGGPVATGAARDSALRGLRTALVCEADLGDGCGGVSAIIGGGPMGFSSVDAIDPAERAVLERIAQHLVERVTFLAPTRPGIRGRSKSEALADRLDRRESADQGRRLHTRLSLDELRRHEPGLAGEYTGALAFEEHGLNAARLCVLNAIGAQEHGAHVLLHHEVVRFEQTAPQCLVRILLRDSISGLSIERTARAVVDVSQEAAPAGAQLQVVLERTVGTLGLLFENLEGHRRFLMPWENVSCLVAPADTVPEGPRHVGVRQLLEDLRRCVPHVGDARVLDVRDDRSDGSESAPRVSSSPEREGEGVFGVVEGPVPSHRIRAEQVIDRVCEHIHHPYACRTHQVVVPGGDGAVRRSLLAERFGVPQVAVRRLVHRHGTRARMVLSRIVERPRERSIVCPCEPVLEGEVRHACRQEGARTLEGVARRTRLGTGPCGGMRCAHRAAQIVAEEQGLQPSIAHAMARDLLTARFRGRLPGMGSAQVRQEQLLVAYLSAGGLRAAKRRDVQPLPAEPVQQAAHGSDLL